MKTREYLKLPIISPEWEPSGMEKGCVKIYMEGTTLIADTFSPGIGENHLESRYMLEASGDHAYADYDRKEKKFGKPHQGAGFAYAVAKDAYNSNYEYSYQRTFDHYDIIIDKTVKEEAETPEKLRAKVIGGIRQKEIEYNGQKDYEAEVRRRKITAREMDLVPDLPEDLKDWYRKISFKDRPHYMCYDTENLIYRCTACGEALTEEESGKLRPIKNRYLKCPRCRTDLELIYQRGKYEKVLENTKRIQIIQRMKEGMAVVRMLSASTVYQGTKEPYEQITVYEQNRHIFSSSREHTCNRRLYGWIYEPADNRSNWKYPTMPFEHGRRWVKVKNKYRSWYGYYSYAEYGIEPAYIYPSDIEKALYRTVYHKRTRPLKAVIELGAVVSMEKLFLCCEAEDTCEFVEFAARGRYRKFLEDCFARHSGIDLLHNIEPRCDANNLMMLSKQNRNRLRDVNGGLNALEWLLEAEKTEQKIPDDVLKDLSEWDLSTDDFRFMNKLMSIVQFRNYIQKQMESYRGKTAQEVISQWKDYLSMAQKLKMKMGDEMIYKPRELKKRHNQCVAELNRRAEIERQKKNRERAREEDARLRRRFPGISKRLPEIKKKYSYEDDRYLIRVPEKLYEIVEEGYNLHHCAGATDRYFDRMERQETYIVFLRKKEAPDTSYYTVEVEPGGAIRQHRGLYDEETDIAQIRPFLKKWQSHIRRQMTEEDHRLEELSKIGREESLQDRLKRFGENDRVYKALLADFMAVECG